MGQEVKGRERTEINTCVDMTEFITQKTPGEKVNRLEGHLICLSICLVCLSVYHKDTILNRDTHGHTFVSRRNAVIFQLC